MPYLAWNGEQVRLEKCVPADGLTAAGFAEFSPTATFTVEDWSGNNTPDPTVDPSTEKLFYSQDFDGGAGGFCAEGDVLSMNPGMARIELDVTDFTVPSGTPGYFGPTEPFLAHQFLAGWMTLNTPSLSPMSSSDFGSQNTKLTGAINDPNGTGNPAAGNNPAFLDVNVSGSMPIDGAMSNLFGGPTTITLPSGWVTLAKALAVDDNPNNTTAYDDWDTSGSNMNVTGHVPGACDGQPVSPFAGPPQTPDSGAYQSPIDNGDNCVGGGADGPFSLGNGGLSTGPTVGPFDPVNASSTDLADGDLNSLDAPMPAARVDLAIAPNSGSSTDTSGVGSLVAADKTVTYSRDFEGDGSPSNLYAPFYDAYIPATARPTDDSSGIDGAFIANNFPGFLDISNDGGKYHFWDTYSLGSNGGGTTSCLNYSTDNDPQGQQGDPGNVYRSLPTGDNDVAVYTDQNGEAQVEYVPGEGYYFDNLGADMNADGGCDLESQGPNAIKTLGTATITATAKYPYKPVDYPSQSSNSVTETVSNAFDKSLGYAPKGTSSSDQLSRIVIAHANDIDGSPYKGETVCFSVDSNAEGVTRFTGYVNGVYYGGSGSTSDPNGSNLGRTCLTTDNNGNAAIEAFDSNQNTVNVIADFVDEGLLRDIPVNFAVSNSSGGNLGSTPGTHNQGGSGTSVPTRSQVARVSPRLATYLKQHQVRRRYERIRFVRLVAPAHGRHYVMLRIQSHHRTARLKMQLGVRHGHQIRWSESRVTRVRANRTVKLSVTRTVSKIRRARLIG